MSQENVELARRFHEAQLGDIEAAMEFVAEDVVAVEFGGRIDTPSVFRGRKEWLGYYGHGAEVFEDYGREIDEWVDAGDWVSQWDDGGGRANRVVCRSRAERSTPPAGGREKSLSISLVLRAKGRPSKR